MHKYLKYVFIFGESKKVVIRPGLFVLLLKTFKMDLAWIKQ